MTESQDPSPVEASDPAEQPVGAPPIPASATEVAHPRFLFFGVLSALSLLADVVTKAWAEVVLGVQTGRDASIVLVKEHLTLTLAYNKGGAWGLLQDSNETLRRPFFLLVSVLAIAFIVSLYARLTPGQRALKWGLPLVLGGALGNLQDSIVRSSVIDFIDYRADWVRSMNTLFTRFSHHWNVTDHWPTYNVADICICIGVGLMALDMLTSRRPHAPTGKRPV
jgi:signal peptidase II